MSRLAPIRAYIESLVHHSAQHDPLSAARHRAFIAPRLLGSFAALAAFPVYLIARGVPGALEILIFAWLVVPILAAYLLSRTGRYELAHALSSLALTGLIAVVASRTGGISSFAAVWLVTVPLEAALSASRRVVATASACALAAACLLIAFGGSAVAPVGAGLMGFGVVSAALYAAGLAFGAVSLARTSFELLYAEEERYRLLARNMSDVITRHAANGTVLFASPAAEQVFGDAPGNLLGHGLFDRVHVADRPAYLSALADAAACGEARAAEFRARRDDKGSGSGSPASYVWVEMRCRPLDRPVAGARAVPTGATAEVVAVMRDITARKAQEQEIEAARNEAVQANAGKTRFLATMSHELRTPLNAIIGFSEILVNEGPMRLDAARRKDYAQLVNESGNHLLAVVNGILDMSKIESGNFEITLEPFAPAPTLRHCCELMELKARAADVTLRVRVPPELPAVLADKRALNQILLNLLSNAIRFTNAGGTVTVSARADGPFIVLTVEDTGIGIAEADLRRVGEPFFQACTSYDRRHDGSGLGLSIVKGLIALHGGRLDIASRLGQGTAVTVRLPREAVRIAAGDENAAPRQMLRPIVQTEMQVRKRA